MAAPTQRGSDVVDCSIVIVTYNSARFISQLLHSLPAAAGDRSIRTIVVDNGSSDDTLRLVRAVPGVTCVESGANLGYSGGINVGRSKGGPARSVLILNPDLRLEPGAITRMLGALDAPGVGIAVSRLVESDGALARSQRRDPTLLRAVADLVVGNAIRKRPAWAAEIVEDPAGYDSPTDVDWATGAAVLVSAECDAEVGDWDEAFFMYSEEVDYAIRARRAGFAVRYVPDAIAVHEGGGSGQSASLAALQALNRVRLYQKYHGRFASALYRIVVAVHEGSRCWKPERRRAARAVLGLAAPPRFPGAPPIAPLRW